MKRSTLSIVMAVAATAMLFAIPALAEDNAAAKRVTFTKDVLPILQENCQDCHRPSGRNMSGMVAPMSFMTYEEARPWAKAISRVVADKEMPPWHAHTDQAGIFKNERTLTDQEIATITTWVDQRALRGNPKDAPAPLTFPEGWYMGEPDLVIAFEEPFFVEDDIEDLYHDVKVSVPLDVHPEDTWVKSIEFQPGSEAVHHIIASATAKGEEGNRASRHSLGGLAPGMDDANYPDGYGRLLPADSTVSFDMHYHKESGAGTGQWDSSSMALKFHDKPVTHEVQSTAIAHGAFEIPPLHGNWKVGGARIFTEDMDLLGMTPHMHLRGVYAKYTAFYPDGSSETLLEVPEYDFNWQTAYGFKEIKKLPAGTRLEWEIRYDNSKENAERVGFNAERSVRFGQPTTDEMDLGWIAVTPSAGIAQGDD